MKQKLNVRDSIKLNLLEITKFIVSDVYYRRKCIVSKEVLKDKIISGRSTTPLGIRLNQLEDFIFEILHDSSNNRIRRSEKIFLKRDMQKFTKPNIENLYKKLFSDKEYFYSLAKGIELPECIEDIIIYTQENLYTNYLHYDDAAVIAFLSLKVNGHGGYKNIKQVIIDEAQDYYPLHYEIFKMLFSNAQYTILGDINQTLEKQEDLSLYEQIGKILNKKRSSLVTMDKSFRCTNEILNYSSKFIAQSFEIKSFNRKGDTPKIYTATDQISLNDMIISEVNSCLEKGYKSIGLICKTERNSISLFAQLKDNIDIKLIKNESTMDLNGVFIIPVCMSKGIEFDAVLICDCNIENYRSEHDKKLLYISCTRALHRLNLFCKGRVSPLLGDI